MVLGITPLVREPHYKVYVSKVYSLLVITGLSIALPFSLCYKQTEFAAMVNVRLVIAALMTASLYAFNCLSILSLPFSMRIKWQHLFNNLIKLEASIPNKSTKVKQYYFVFFFVNAFFWTVTISDLWIWYDIVGWEYIQQYLMDGVQTYFVLIYSLVLHALIRSLAGYYDNLRHLLENRISQWKKHIHMVPDDSSAFLVHNQHLFALLKDTVDVFNDIFGWPILLVLVYTGLLVIDYLDYTFKNYDGLDNNDFYKVATSNVFLVFLFFVCTHL